MNSLERVMATVTGDKTDYQPFTMLLSLYGSSLIKADVVEYYRNPNLWFQGQKAVVEAFDPDILITPFSFPLEAETFGSEMVFLDKYAPNVKKPIISDLSQIENLQIPDINSKGIQYFLQATSLLSEFCSGTKAIGAPIQSPCDMPALLFGLELWIDTLLFQPKYMEMILEKTMEHFIRLGNEFLAKGATFLVVPLNFTNSMMITKNILIKLLPYLEKAFSQIKGPIVIHNGGCILKPFMNYFVNLPNVIAFVLDPREKFEDARQIIGPDKVLMGNFDGPRFANFTPEKAKDICLNILNDRKNDKHFIFATASADIPYDTSVETIKTVVDTIRNFKKY